MRILISRPDKIGDVTLALHGAKQLKRRLPSVEVFVHVSEYTLSLVSNVKFVDGCVLVTEDLTPYNFDAVVDLMAKNRTARLYIKPRIRIRIGNSARWFSFLYNRTRFIRRSYALMNEAEYNWQLISLLDPSLKNTRLTETLDVHDFKEIVEYTEYKNYYVLMPGATVSAIGWDLKNWIDLAERLADDTDAQVLFLTGPAEKEIAAELRQKTVHKSNIQLRSFDDPKELIGFLKNAKAYVGPSTGITHLASALGLKGVALYPELRSMHPTRWMPFNSSLTVYSLDKNPSALDVYNALHGRYDPRFLPIRRASISAFVVCCNEEKNMVRCLESLKWCDEIVIVDSGSTDRTVEICRQYTDRIFYRKWNGHSEQKQFALDQCRGDWILNIDADEEVSTELKSQILRVLGLPKRRREAIKGYEVCRVVYFLGRWWDHGGWYPEYRMRFFQRRCVRWGGVNPHEKALIDGKTRRLKGAIYHYTYSGIPHQVECLNRHSSNSAKYLYLAGKRTRFANIILNPAFRFFKFYILKRGFREGRAGFVVGCIEACYTFLKYVKLWEIQGRVRTGEVADVSNL
ncbi:MAG: glycosyltransferase [Deltaproteobacteria bacterium]|nr:glycosyltransferase [Deltaproteobacteria bacterium]